MIFLETYSNYLLRFETVWFLIKCQYPIKLNLNYFPDINSYKALKDFLLLPSGKNACIF